MKLKKTYLILGTVALLSCLATQGTEMVGWLKVRNSRSVWITYPYPISKNSMTNMFKNKEPKIEATKVM